MDNGKEKIKEEIKALVAKSNGFLTASQNKDQVVASLYIILSLIALSFFGLLAIGPTITTIANLNKQYNDGQAALKQLQDKNASLKSLGAQYIDIQPDLELINNAIPQSPKVAELTRQLEVLSIKDNLVVNKIDTGLMQIYPSTKVSSPVFSYSFSINVTGNEKDINAFLGDIINMGRIIGIERLSTGKQNDLFTASITGKAFFYKP